MNKENVLKVADAIEQHSIPDLGFNMSDYVVNVGSGDYDKSGHSCRTIACIAGWAHVLDGGARNCGSTEIFEHAKRYLGLTDNQADNLFVWIGGGPRPSTFSFSQARPEHAVAVLRHLARTRKVDWSVADKVPANV